MIFAEDLRMRRFILSITLITFAIACNSDKGNQTGSGGRAGSSIEGTGGQATASGGSLAAESGGQQTVSGSGGEHNAAGSGGISSDAGSGGASGGGAGTIANISEIKSKLTRNANPNVSAAQLQQLASNNRQFAFEFYQKLAAGYKNQNLFFSPYSISTALAMAYAGARGQTETQMATTLHFNLPQESLHAAFNSESLQLDSRGQGASGKDGKGFRLNVANSIWGQSGYPFVDSFLDCLAVNYGAGLNTVDFANNPETCRLTINSWVEEKTEGRIKDLLQPGSVDAQTRMVLVNAVYFNAAWLKQFKTGATSLGAFNLLSGSSKQVNMMHQTDSFNYFDADGYTAIELSYDGNQLSMVMVVPDQGQFSTVEASLAADVLDTIVAGLQSQQVELSMPRWRFTTDIISLSGMFRQMGMKLPFDSSSADFSGIATVEKLSISDIVHKAFIEVDESGTEAAAATAISLSGSAMPPPPILLNIDRPFIYFIRDIATNTIIFAGRVVDPS
jgi:serpin B